MRFDHLKAWPWPVLRPHSIGDDYPRAEFEVEIEVKRVEGTTGIEIILEFQLSDEDLRELIVRDSATFAILIKATKTHYRIMHRSKKANWKVNIDAGQLSGLVQCSPFLICTKEIKQFSSSGWHDDYSGHSFHIPVGAVLAEDRPQEYWIDTTDEAPLGSIFGLRSRPDVTDGHWQVDLHDDRIWIAMSERDEKLFSLARERVSDKPDGNYLMNGLYLPALVKVLCTVDRDVSEYQNFRWFASLDRRLIEAGCSQLGNETSERLVDAQKLLDSPFTRMPMIAETRDIG